jgi:hypothetical protein
MNYAPPMFARRSCAMPRMSVALTRWMTSGTAREGTMSKRCFPNPRGVGRQSEFLTNERLAHGEQSGVRTQ